MVEEKKLTGKRGNNPMRRTLGRRKKEKREEEPKRTKGKKIRNVPHIIGNFACFLYIDITLNSHFLSHIKLLSIHVLYIYIYILFMLIVTRI